MSKLSNILARFGADTGGAVAVIFGVSVIVLFLVLGLAIDSARLYNNASKIQNAMDAAALSGAKLFDDDTASDGDITNRAKDHFNSYVAAEKITGAEVENLTFTPNRTEKSVYATAHVTLPTSFGKIGNVMPEFSFNPNSTVVYKMNKIELAMVLDITGSMNANNKLPDMKVAAKDVIDGLLQASPSENSVRIAIAPFSASVNAGSLAAAVSASPSVTTCSQTWNDNYTCKDVAGADIDTCVIERTNTNAATDAAPVGADILPAVPSTPYGKYTCPPSIVIPLQGRSQIAMLETKIDGYAATGSTAGHIGAAWGWYLISPNWTGVLPSASAPEPYSNPDVKKNVIFMTDGLFNTSYLNGPSTADATQVNESYAQFDALCGGMKAKGITVYTVGFDLSDPSALSELQNCASSSTDFYNAQGGLALKAAFHDIASKLNTLRVSK